MVNLILDTNIWLYLANGFDSRSNKLGNLHFELLNEISTLVDQGKIRVFTNDIIIKEWKRNKFATLEKVKNLENFLDNSKMQMKIMREKLGEEGKSKADDIIKELEKSIEDEIKENKSHIDAVENFLLNNTTNIPIKESTRAKVTHIAEEKKAPFHNKSNSFADAVIFMSACEHFQWQIEMQDEYDMVPYFGMERTIFVTNNSDDFCEKKGTSKIHPDLAQYCVPAKIEVELNLAKALNLSQSTILKIEEEMKLQNSKEPCLAECAFSEYGAYVIYNRKFIIENEGYEKHHFNPSQTQLEFGNDYILDQQKIEEAYYRGNSVFEFGYCSHCSSMHVRCCCGDEHIVDNYNIECKCGNVILVENDKIIGILN
ncbi:hypothetical protein LX64_04183 [Chitinophaga skermanii]|uniref:DUF4935 domain-containing protein n=1 Tax=Chitinophaga skermanii TaxID=331697 RepID=A0A327QFL7_9BACT|nr:PIN domain-containing protein [Chitinophaga skermanii]RAJ00477.1 hypothetical protein LX64_04183 [Chitinophaga skermanii]